MAERLGKVPWALDDGRRVQRALVRCDCGLELVCARFTNTCECGRDYGLGGDLLALRGQWGEETGETAADLLVSDETLALALED